jgi:hypothetical protein
LSAKRNYHLFQPLLYQVATAALSPADIAEPIRRVLATAKNINVVLAEVSGIETSDRVSSACAAASSGYRIHRGVLRLSIRRGDSRRRWHSPVYDESLLETLLALLFVVMQVCAVIAVGCC